MTFSLISLCPLLPLPVMPRQDGKVAIVTGGGKGIGYEVVRHMARLGAHVIIGTVSNTAPLTHKRDERVNTFMIKKFQQLPPCVRSHLIIIFIYVIPRMTMTCFIINIYNKTCTVTT